MTVAEYQTGQVKDTITTWQTWVQADFQQAVCLGQVVGTVVLLVVVMRMMVVYLRCRLVQEEEDLTHVRELEITQSEVDTEEYELNS